MSHLGGEGVAPLEVSSIFAALPNLGASGRMEILLALDAKF